MVQGIAALSAQDKMMEANQAPSTPGSEDVVSSLGKAFSSLSAKEIQELKSLSDQLQEMPVEQLKALAQVIQFIQKKSDQYDIAIQTLIRQGIVEAGDLPPDYVPAFYDILAGLVQDAMSKVQETPPSELEKPAFAKGGIADLKSAGRYGDTTVAHLSPKSAAILKRNGGSGTINPKTGLVEYGLLGNIFGGIGKFLKSAAGVILPVALNFAFPGLGTIASGAIGAGLGAMINGANPGEALGAALTGGIGGALMGGVSGLLGGQGFMAGVTGALPSGFMGSTNTSPYLADFLGGKPYTPSSAANPNNYVGGSDLGGYSGTGNSSYNPGSSAADPGILSKIGGFVSEHPYLTAAGAALAGTALGSSLSQAKGQPAMELPPGATPEQIAAARFPAGAFTSKAAPKVQLTPTFSPAYARGGETDARGGGHMEGPGTGTSDDIPARLSDGEFVMTAKAVRGAGGGSREKGARKMYDMMHQFEKRA